VTVGVMIHLGNQITDLRNEKEKLEKEYRQLQSQLDGVVAAREQLKVLKDGCEKKFSKHLKNLTDVWHYATIDAVKIQTCLVYMSDNAEDFDEAAMRKHQMPNLGLSVGLYRAVARYMRRYADGVTTAQLTKKS